MIQAVGSGRTTIALSKIMKNRGIVALDKFDAPYIEGGGKTLLENNLKIAKISAKVKIVSRDITALKFADNTFDTVASSYVLDHLGKKKLIALQEINRVLKLKPGGKSLLIVALPNYFTSAVASFLCAMLFTSKRRWK